MIRRVFAAIGAAIRDIWRHPDRYRKWIVAAVGCAVGIAGRHLGPDSAIVFDLTLVATAFGVYRIPNEAMP